MNKVQEQFASALGADDFMQRVEMALYAFGFNGDNSIGGWQAQGHEGREGRHEGCTCHNHPEACI